MTIDNRVPAGVPTGGQFASQNRSEADASLTEAPAKYVVPLFGQVDLSPNQFEPLPDYPEGLPEAEVSIGYSNGNIHAWITAGDVGVSFWGIDHGDRTEPFNSVTDGRDTTDWDDETEEAFLEWGTAVWERVDASAYGAAIQAVRGDVADAIVAVATDRPYAPSNPVYTAEEMENDAPKRGVSRAAAGLEQWFSRGAKEDVDDYTVQGALSDIRHYAETLGMDWSELLERSEQMYEDEVRNPVG